MSVRRLVPMVFLLLGVCVMTAQAEHAPLVIPDGNPQLWRAGLRPSVRARQRPDLTAPPSSTVPTELVAAPLLTQMDLVYTGSFRLPSGPDDPRRFDYGGLGLAFNPAGTTLFLAGHDWYQWIAELYVPEIRQAHTVEDLATATFKQPLTPVFGHEFRSVGDTVSLGGLLVRGDTLIATAYDTYDAEGVQSRSHFRRSVNLSDPAIAGPSRIAGTHAGFVAGYMAAIPPDWQPHFGGPALTGQCCISIISRTSLGPAASVFDPADVGADTVAGTEVVGYPITQPTLGLCEGASVSFNCATRMGGMVFPQGTRSVLFFGRQGLGRYCYGTGGTSGGECYDPADDSKGPHAYPYVYQVWAYDALDLVAAKQGLRPPWEVLPYRTWTLDLPFGYDGKVIRSVAYDPHTSRVFVTASFADGTRPLIHVLTVRH